LDDSLLLVTESCVPLDVWLSTVNDSRDGSNPSDFKDFKGVIQDIIWGMRCILTALEFLHTNSLSHNYVCLNAIYVTKSGDWKLGAFDLTAGFTSDEDLSFLNQNGSLLAATFTPPEVQTSSSTSKYAKCAIHEIDIYSTAQTFLTVFDRLATSDNDGNAVPDTLNRVIKRMMSKEPKRRPTAATVLAKCTDFTSESVNMMINLDNIAMQSYGEAHEVLIAISSKVSELSMQVCEYKILPLLNRKLQMALSDFTVRETKESSRQVLIIINTIYNQFLFFNPNNFDVFAVYSDMYHRLNKLGRVKKNYRNKLLSNVSTRIK
jgi:SCY1-like protein 1